MQLTGSAIFLALLLAHLAADFLLQTDRLRAAKQRMMGKAYLRHGLAHALCNWTALLFLSGEGHRLPALAAAAAGLAVFHVASDWLKYRATWGWNADGPAGIILDQIWHLASLAGCTWLLKPEWVPAVRTALQSGWVNREQTLAAVAIYGGVVFAGAVFVRSCTRPLLEQFSGLESSSQGAVRQLKNAGMYIGWLERFVVLTAMLLHSPATIGLVLAAKAIVRFPEMKDLRFAEYFLIGTLLSLSIALAGGVLLLKLIHGRIAVP
jgi:hypothetical protein